MAQEYQIAKVSPKTKTWEGQYGQMVTYYVLLEGQGQEPVEINKKPDSPAPLTGDTVYGTLTSSQYGMKFKSEKRPFASGNRGGYQKDDREIRALAVMKSSMEYAARTGIELQTPEGIEAFYKIADNAYHLVDRLKGTLESPKTAVQDVIGKDEIPLEPKDSEIPF